MTKATGILLPPEREYGFCSHRISQANQQIMYHATSTLLSSIPFQFSTGDHAFRRSLVPHVKAYYGRIAGNSFLEHYNEEQYVNIGLAFYEDGHRKEMGELFVQMVELH